MTSFVLAEVDDPPIRRGESAKAHAARATKWKLWRAQEPLLDLSCVGDTEVAEYRRWAKTAGWHQRTVDEMIALAKL